MCFTVLLSSWLIVHGAPLAAAVQPANYNTHVNNVTLIYYKTPGASETSEDGADDGADALMALRTLHDDLLGLDSIPDCDNGSVPVCLVSSECPSHAEGQYRANKTYESVAKCSTFLKRNTGKQTIDEEPTSAEVWGYGFLTVFIISLSGLFGGLLWPLMSSKYYHHVMRMLIGLAVGSLCSTSAFQLIPQGFGFDENSADYINVSLTLLGSFWALYMFEITCKIIFHQKPTDETTPEVYQQEYLSTTLPENKEIVAEEDGLLNKSNAVSINIKPPQYSSKNSVNKNTIKQSNHVHIGGLTPIALMITLGDGLHNFVDGMSIGAGFSKDLKTGLTISIAIACEEFPHELGDFAILINSGLSFKKSLFLNFMSALTAVLGFIVGVLLGQMEANIIFAFAGGLFLYISLTDLMPELNSMVTESLEKHNRIAALVVLLEQNCGIFLGFFLLYTISTFPVY